MAYSSLKEIVKAIQDKEITCGRGKQYCFILDHDGEIVFLKDNPLASEYRKDIARHGETYHGFPANEYDGEVIWKEYVGKSGLEIVANFLDILGIEYLD